MKKKLVVFSGSGVSAESGLKTFRDSDGLWEEYNVYEVATPQAWEKDPALVQEFYNKRRKQIYEAIPNKAHEIIADLEKDFEVRVITQNIDDLHERAGSSKVLHLHGEIRKARSTVDPTLIYDLPSWELKMGDLCEKGSQLRPHIVWFGEMVPEMENAAMLASDSEILIVVGSSLNVYPAAGLLNFVPYDALKFVVDPSEVPVGSGFRHIKLPATQGMQVVAEELRKIYQSIT